MSDNNNDNNNDEIRSIGLLGSVIRTLGSKLAIIIITILLLLGTILIITIIAEKPITISTHIISTHNNDRLDDAVTLVIE